MDNGENTDPQVDRLTNARNEVCVCIERLLYSATGRAPQGGINEVLLRIVRSAASYYYSPSDGPPISDKDTEQLATALWSVLISDDIESPLDVQEGLLPGIVPGVSRLTFAEDFVPELVVLVPASGIPDLRHGAFDRQLLCNRFEEFLVTLVLFHLIEESGAWLSMSVALSKLFEFINALSLPTQEPVCRDLLTAMVTVDEVLTKRFWHE